MRDMSPRNINSREPMKGTNTATMNMSPTPKDMQNSESIDMNPDKAPGN